METIVSYLPILDSFLKEKYPNCMWVRGDTLEHIDKNNQKVYYETSYRLFSPTGRWNAIVSWRKGEEPKLQNVWR